MSHENKQLDIYAQVAAHHAKVGDSPKLEDRIIGKAPELGMGFGEPDSFAVIALNQASEQAQATIKEMGELIDQQAAELTRLKGNINYMVEGCTCARAVGIPREDA